MDKYLNALKQMQWFLSIMPSEHKKLKMDLDSCNSEIIDILHDIEFSKLDRTTGSRKAKTLQKAQRRRREDKENIEITAILNQFAESNHKLISDIQKVLNRIQSIQKTQEDRTYIPRVNTDMEIAFKHYDKETETLD